VEFFDLTLPLHPGMPVHPGDPAVTFARARSHEADGYEVTRLSLGSHSGTHLDAPRHLFPDGATLDQYPVDRLVGQGAVIDCRPLTGDTIDDALLAERLCAFPIPSGGFLLLWTEGALLTVEAADLLLETGPGLVGTDAPSLDAEPYPVHQLLLGHGVLLAEGLRGLDRLGPGPVACAFLPLAVVGTDGAPVRAVAWR
jgi:arylformamidase